MSPAQGQSRSGIRDVLAMESAILGRVKTASDDFQRTDCLDEEQRAEIHAILQAIRHDNESHTLAISALMARLGGSYDA